MIMTLKERLDVLNTRSDIQSHIDEFTKSALELANDMWKEIDRLERKIIELQL